MPELPEIETVKKTLEPLLCGRRVEKIEMIRDVVIKYPQAKEFAARLCGCTITGLTRRGKYLLIHFDDGQTLIAHLRMTGRLLCVPQCYERKPHTHVIISLNDGQELRFSDTRRFGCLWLLANEEDDFVTGIHKLGPEPFSKEFDAVYLQKKLGQRRTAVKSALLDQRVIAGLGNIYVDETLFAAGIHPARLCCHLSTTEWQAIADAIPIILNASIAHNGTTFNDFLDGEGREGQNLPFLQVYGRNGEPCRKCGEPIQKIRIGGRGTCFCARCQK